MSSAFMVPAATISVIVTLWQAVCPRSPLPDPRQVREQVPLVKIKLALCARRQDVGNWGRSPLLVVTCKGKKQGTHYRIPQAHPAHTVVGQLIQPPYKPAASSLGQTDKHGFLCPLQPNCYLMPQVMSGSPTLPCCPQFFPASCHAASATPLCLDGFYKRKKKQQLSQLLLPPLPFSAVQGHKP